MIAGLVFPGLVRACKFKWKGEEKHEYKGELQDDEA
jgi:hypothetical protein